MGKVRLFQLGFKNRQMYHNRYSKRGFRLNILNQPAVKIVLIGLAPVFVFNTFIYSIQKEFSC